MKPLLSSRRAFTLIEILVVISILALLCALLFPVFLSARDRARASSCASNLHQMGLSMTQYAADYDGKLAFAPNPATKEVVSRPETLYGEPLDSIILRLPDVRFVLRPYGTTTSLFRCPSDQMSNNLLRDITNAKSSQFEQWGSSYNYDERSGFAGKSLGSYSHPAQAWLMSDADAFHGAGVNMLNLDQSLSNLLYVDGHVKLISWPQVVESLEEAQK